MNETREIPKEVQLAALVRDLHLNLIHYRQTPEFEN